MIKLIDRNALKNMDFISYIIGSVQKANYDGIISDINDEIELNEFLDSKKRYDFIDSYNNKYQDLFICNKIINIKVNNIDDYLKVFPEKFFELIKKLYIEDLIIVLNERCNWFYQKNKYKPVKNAYNQLRKIVNKKEYYEAFNVDLESIKEFIKIIFWFSRCNASLPEINIISKEISTNFMICKYGNLHIEIYKKEVEVKIIEFVQSNINLEIIENENEFLDDFKGRKIIV